MTDNGEATYSIPLWMPPRQGGEPPSLAISYSSTGGNGVLGMGWSLSGDVTSSITRCTRSVAADGEAAAIAFDNSTDPLCLDGKRLRLFAYGDGPTLPDEYRTEEDQYTVVLGAYRNDSSAKRSYFQAEAALKDGRLFYYGETGLLQGFRAEYDLGSDGQITALSKPNDAAYTSVLGTMLTSISYPQGSPVKISYLTSLDDGFAGGDFSSEQHISSIEYSDGLLRRVRFDYDTTRPDKFSRYVSGLKLTTTRRLKAIVVEAGPSTESMQTLRSYTFQYDTEPRNNLSFLHSVQECDGASVCKAPSVFHYTPYDIDFVAQPDPQITDIAGVGKFGDLNGDGKDDVVYRTAPDRRYAACKLWYRYSTGTGFGPPVELSDIESATPDLENYCAGGADIRLLDIDMDGRTDILFTVHKSAATEQEIGHWAIYRSTPNGFVPMYSDSELRNVGIPSKLGSSEDTKSSWYGPPRILAGDMTGDGLPELLRQQGHRLNPLEFETVGLGLWAMRINENGVPSAYHDLAYWFAPGSSGSPDGGTAELGFYYGDRLLMADIDGSGRLAMLSPIPDPTSSGSAEILKDRVNGIPYRYSKYHLRYSHNGPPIEPGAPATFDFDEVKRQLTIVTDPDDRAGVDGKLAKTAHVMADMNGDGLPDAVGYPMRGGDPWVAFNYGGNFGSHHAASLSRQYMLGQSLALSTGPYDYGSPNSGGRPPAQNCSYLEGRDNGVRVADIDQDGRQDLVLLDAGVMGHGAVFKGAEPAYCTPEGDAVGPRTQVSFLRVDDNGQWRAATLSPAIPIAIDPPQLYPQSPRADIADINGDGLPDIVAKVGDESAGSAKLQIWTQKGKGGMLTQVDDAYGEQVRVAYKPISDAAVHTQGSCKAPLQCTNRGKWVVSSHELNSGTSDGMNRFTHTYKGATIDTQGRGWLGFTEHAVQAEQTRTTVRTTFEPGRDLSLSSSGPYPRVYPRAGRPVSQETTVTVQSGHQLRTVQNWTYDVKVDQRSHTYHVNLVRHDTSDVDLTGGASEQWYRGTLTEFAYDDYGNVLSKKSVVTDRAIQPSDTFDGTPGEKVSAASTFDNFKPYLLGLERTRTITSTAVDGRSATRSWSYEYVPATRLLQLETAEPGGGVEFEQTRTYDWYPNGLLRQVTEGAGAQADRLTTIEYDALTGSFPYQIMDPEGHVTTMEYEPMRGLLLSATDPNLVKTSVQYDGLGRERVRTRPDGTVQTTDYAVVAGSPKNLLQVNLATPEAGPAAIGFDTLERPVTSTSLSFSGQERTSTRQYDRIFGSTALETAPTDSDTPGISHSEQLDVVGRLISRKTGFDLTTYVYSLRDVHVTEPAQTRLSLQRTQVLERDPSGRVVVRTEKDDLTDIKTRYDYGPFGLLESITDTKGNVTRFSHDRLGRRTSVESPSTGTTTMTYTGFGELFTETDANKVTRRYDRDRLGRVYLESVTEAGKAAQFASTTWDTAAYGIGKVASATSLDGVTTSYQYDSFGRLSIKTTAVAGESYAMEYRYDGAGRLGTMLYPETQLASGATDRLSIDYAYRTNGELEKITRSGTTEQYWRANLRNARGQLRQETFGDGVVVKRGYEQERGLPEDVTILDGTKELDAYIYTYGSSRFLTGRYWPRANEYEAYSYDNLNRLEKWTHETFGVRNAWSVSYEYDDIGNLTRRSFAPENRGGGESLTYEYSGVNAGPDAVTSSPWGSYSYDAKGNRISSPDGTITYTPFDLPKEMLDAGGSVVAQFAYGPDGQRTKKQQARKDNRLLLDSTVYVDGLFERRSLDQVDAFVHYIIADQHRRPGPMVRHVARSRGLIPARRPTRLGGAHHQPDRGRHALRPRPPHARSLRQRGRPRQPGSARLDEPKPNPLARPPTKSGSASLGTRRTSSFPW